MRFTRIAVNAAQMGGVPCIRGLRIPVSTVVGMVAEGMAEAEIIDAFPDLEPEDIHEALRYAAEAVRERELPLGSSSITPSHRAWRRAYATMVEFVAIGRICVWCSSMHGLIIATLLLTLLRTPSDGVDHRDDALEGRR